MSESLFINAYASFPSKEDAMKPYQTTIILKESSSKETPFTTNFPFSLFTIAMQEETRPLSSYHQSVSRRRRRNHHGSRSSTIPQLGAAGLDRRRSRGLCRQMGGGAIFGNAALV